jgi:hypothetical protein
MKAAARKDVRVPLLAALCAVASVVIVAAVLGYSPWDSSTWSRWDSGNYEDIARDGYNAALPCKEEPDRWCSDAGWFPGYPWVFGGLHLLGLPLRGSAVAVSWLLAAGTIVLIWATFLERRTDAAVTGALFYAAFAPGQIYHYAVFPLSLLAFATVAFLWLLFRERYVAAGAAGAVAALTYPAGILLAPLGAAWLVLQRSVPLGTRLQRAAITSGLILAGVWILMIDQRLETGHWDAYLLVQQKYEHEFQNPFLATWDMVRGGVEHVSSGISVAVALQTALVTVTLAIVLVNTFRRNRWLSGVDSLLVLWALATWALPLSQTGVSAQRGQASLLPLAILVARLPARLVWALALAAAMIAVWMERYFLDYTLF